MRALRWWFFIVFSLTLTALLAAVDHCQMRYDGCVRNGL